MALRLFFSASCGVAATTGFCRRGDACWPTQAELSALAESLNPESDRNLHWAGEGSPLISAVPALSPGNQPLFGMNENLQPLYVQEEGASPDCASFSYGTDFCKQSTRNLPKSGVSPAFVAWPLTTSHVQELVAFATRHSLCMAVVSTGHDFLNRHTCDQGLMIRTAMMKGVDWDLAGDELSGKFGAGVIFSEVMASASQQKPSVYVASGWAQTVGVVGWGLGGGHGPHGRTHGFGVDNLLEVEVVLADGSVAVANKDQHVDLFWALRGGGGSTWGVVTSVRYRAHVTPASGFTVMILLWNQTMCGSDRRDLHQLLGDYPEWARKRSTKWSGLAFFQTGPAFVGDECEFSWTGTVKYVYRGSQNDEEFVQAKAKLGVFHRPQFEVVNTYENMWQLVQAKSIAEDYILPLPLTVDNSTIGVPSVQVADKDVGFQFYEAMRDQMDICTREPGILPGIAGVCVSLYHDIPSTDCAEPAPEGSTSLHPGFRAARFHAMAQINTAANLERWLSFGDASYFSESTFNMEGWQQRYWGENYARLLDIKQAVDPNSNFWCHHCVGSELGTQRSTWLV